MCYQKFQSIKNFNLHLKLGIFEYFFKQKYIDNVEIPHTLAEN